MLTVSRDVIKQVEILMEKDSLTMCAGCKLYTPNLGDYKRCPITTLNCFSAEVKVLLMEWEVRPKPPLERGLKFLAAELPPQTESESCQCELHKEEDAKDFLSQLNKMLQAINSDDS
uniref:interleukin 15, like isoform X2 n=1 Tax=Doryrhamphus excisus TaxID=161450 RepID=UPI0025ADACEA|nr:interleukin 15, like isoform X2 [Doryrhamphus excisus]